MARTEGSITKSWLTTANVLYIYTHTLTPPRTSSHFCVSYVQKSTFVCRAKHRRQVAVVGFLYAFCKYYLSMRFGCAPFRAVFRSKSALIARWNCAECIGATAHRIGNTVFFLRALFAYMLLVLLWHHHTLRLSIAKIAQPRAAMPFFTVGKACSERVIDGNCVGFKALEKFAAGRAAVVRASHANRMLLLVSARIIAPAEMLRPHASQQMTDSNGERFSEIV